MVKRRVKEREIKEYLKDEGFQEIKESEKRAKWYTKASESPSCLRVLRAVQKGKIKI